MEVEDLLDRKMWETQKDEDRFVFLKRKKLQTRHIRDLYKRRGPCYMIKFGDCKDGAYDLRPMFEDQISVAELRKQIKSPEGGELDCPLCQPYDNYSYMNNVEKRRRYLCKIVNPLYEHGAIGEEGVYTKCACVAKPIHRKAMKFVK